MNKLSVFILLLFFLNGLFVPAFSSVSASSELIADSWNTKTPMTQARSGLGVVAVDGKIYAIGGVTDNGYVGTNERYDPKTDTWSTMTAMPTSRSNFAIVEYNGKIYCMGGFVNHTMGDMGVVIHTSCRIIEVYDIATDSWSTKASMPITVSPQIHVINEKIFVLSMDDLYRYGNLYMYNPVADSWTKTTSLPREPYKIGQGIRSYYLISTATIDEILFTGLFDYAQEAMMYNPETDVWRQIASPPFGIFYDTAIATKGDYAPQKIYLLTSTTSDEVGNTRNDCYDPVNDSWTRIETILTPRIDCGVAVVDDILYVIGGYQIWRGNITPPLSTNEQYVPFNYKDATTAKPYLIVYIVIAVFALTIGIITAKTFFILRRKQRKKSPLRYFNGISKRVIVVFFVF